MTTPKRPSSYDEPVVLATATALLPEVARWCQIDSDDEAERTDLLKSLAKAIRHERDGYKLVRELENYAYIDGDAELVDIMDAAAGHIYDAERKAVAEWVKAYQIEPGLSVGAEVSFPWGFETATGTITEIRHSEGRYLIKKPGDQEFCGSLIAYEKATLLNQEAV